MKETTNQFGQIKIIGIPGVTEWKDLNDFDKAVYTAVSSILTSRDKLEPATTCTLRNIATEMGIDTNDAASLPLIEASMQKFIYALCSVSTAAEQCIEKPIIMAEKFTFTECADGAPLTGYRIYNASKLTD